MIQKIKKSQLTVGTVMGGEVDKDNIKTVSVKVTADELKGLSRTRRRRRTPAVQRTEEAQEGGNVATPIVKPIEIEKKPETPVTPVTPAPTVEPKSDVPVKLPIQIGSKRGVTRKNTGTTAAAPGTPGAAANGTSVPKIIYSKKRVAGTQTRASQSPLQIKSKSVLKVKPRKTRRTFSARKIAVTVGGPKLTHRYTSPEKMRAELERHGVLKQNSKMPDEKLRRLYQDFRSL